MADISEPRSGELPLFGSDVHDDDPQLGQHDSISFGSNSPCRYPENWTPCSDPGDVFAGSAEAVNGATASASSERLEEKRSQIGRAHV